MPYDEIMISPMRQDLTRLGARELFSADAVDDFLAGEGTRFVFINSVCGCAAGQARPGLAQALANGAPKPDAMGTVFAGQDMEATARVREGIPGEAPSSPSAALFKDGRMVWYIPRKTFVKCDADEIARHFVEAFENHCKGE